MFLRPSLLCCSSSMVTAQSFVLFVLDGDSILSELYWDGSRWNGLRQFSAIDAHSGNATHAFSSFAVTEDGNLFAVYDGTMLWYRRTGDWWIDGFGGEDPTWRLMEVVNTTLVED
ncbi:hypothetical protein LIA77_06517 [Sarocladium implicatum]|nr:hypothetical protein LIA77_06517 [Sarocladium implicatum]